MSRILQKIHFQAFVTHLCKYQEADRIVIQYFIY